MTNYEMLRNKDKMEFAYWLANIHANCDYNPFCPACESKEWARCECKGGVDGDACADLWLNWLEKNKEDDGTLNTWISVEDRLPELNEKIIVWDKYGDIHRARFEGGFWDKGGHWREVHTGRGLHGIKYWIPYPELPDREELKQQTGEENDGKEKTVCD